MLNGEYSVEMVAGQNVPYIQIPRHCVSKIFPVRFLHIFLHFTCWLDAKWLMRTF